MKLEHEHSQTAIQARLAEETSVNYLRDWVYGSIDGAVTTFAVVSGVVGAQLSLRVILILGVANLLADGFSMAAGNYSATKSELDDAERLREIERKHIRQVPEGEREEIRQILIAKGLQGSTLEEATDAITSNEELWINTMLAEEYGISPVSRDPLRSALVTFSAFFLCGAIPLAPFILGLENAFTTSALLTAAVFFLTGMVKSRWSLAPWWRSGSETLLIGGLAAAVSYGVGYLLRGVVG
ncbi:VIT1/CCC1 transporter family protein [Kiloniella laminariae]|uniref:VIT1/CCC1 transporter family protein n=1 Tax=Kiloniella laminariae TaxID=454162 RepID=A0ABT4LF37_9PROT|nr:VIT1/CCC1 transporter family protein [Kiloniella laminariae]MCZ4279708.1 VIT1/CCC1 transporter family protein [Kiloniella laminariae]